MVFRKANDESGDYLSLHNLAHSLQLHILSYRKVKHVHVAPVLVPIGIDLRLVIHDCILHSFSIEDKEIVCQIELQLGQNKDRKHDQNIVVLNMRPDRVMFCGKIANRGNSHIKRNWHNQNGVNKSEEHVEKGKLGFWILVPSISVNEHCVEDQANVGQADHSQNADENGFDMQDTKRTKKAYGVGKILYNVES